MANKQRIEKVICWYFDEKGIKQELLADDAYLRVTKEVIDGKYTGRLINTIIAITKTKGRTRVT